MNLQKWKQRGANLLPFRYPNFGKLFFGQLVSNIGSQFSYVALQFLIYDLTNDIFAMAVLAIAETLPMILVGPWAGVIVDRVDRKYSMVLANLGQACAIILIPITIVLPNRAWWIIGLAFLNSVFARFFFPARGASIPKLVEKREDLLAANSLSAGAYQVSALIGPFLAGIIIGTFGYDIPFIIDSFSFVFSSLSILWISISLRAEQTQRQTPLQDLISGATYIKNFQPISFILILFSVLMFAGGASLILIIPYLRTEFGLVEQGAGEMVFGVMTAGSAAIGMTVALLLSRKKDLSKPVTLISWTSLLAGVMLFGFGIASSLWVLAIFWIGFGTIEVLVGIPLQTLTQETVPDQLRGKIFSFINLSITIAQIMGMGIVSIIANTSLGIRGSLITNGIVLVLFFIVGYIWLIRKNLEIQVKSRKEELYKQLKLV